jgi:hypothetical protein
VNQLYRQRNYSVSMLVNDISRKQVIVQLKVCDHILTDQIASRSRMVQEQTMSHFSTSCIVYRRVSMVHVEERLDKGQPVDHMYHSQIDDNDDQACRHSNRMIRSPSMEQQQEVPE